MAGKSPLSEEELAGKAGAIKLLSLSVLAVAGISTIITVSVWLFNWEYPIIPLAVAIVVGLLISAATYGLVRAGKVRFAGYFFVICFLFEIAIITTLLGGFSGPIVITYLFPIVAASVAIGINASFFIATVAAVLFLAMIPVERAGLLPQLIAPGTRDAVIPFLAVATRLVFFYFIAFLSWFAGSRLNQAYRNVRRYAVELQATNEKLRASEEELRAANEELQATEEELRTSNEELEATNEELREAQEQVVRSERLAAIGQLAGGVGHELRNPLGAIKNAAYYVKKKVAKSELAQKEPRVAEFLDIMDDEINSSNKIISDLLGFSRVGKPATSPAKINKVIDDALTRVSIPENIELSRKLDAGPDEVEVDPEQIQQVLVNMIANAVQAMPEGGRLVIGAGEGDGFLEVRISDTGCGLPREIRDKIFEPLFTTRAKGIGLGLSVSKSIVDRHGGQIEVESREGEGSTFKIRLPRAAA